MSPLSALRADLQSLASPAKAKILSGFFKTGKGEYGEGDVFLGITVPQQREVAQKHLDLPLEDIEELLNSKIHEHRLTALIILVEQFKKASKRKDEQEKKRLFEFYLKNTKQINNWDLVDCTARDIAGAYLFDRGEQGQALLDKLSVSEMLWERRIAMVATHHFINKGQFAPTLRIAKRLLKDEHDLMHKATGWMLREMGKKGGEKELREFLDAQARTMPRTMLRYAIERMPQSERKEYLRR